MTIGSLVETVTDHRPWPLPRGPWALFMRWHDLLLAHWPVPAAQLQALVPAPLEIDTWQGEAWLGVVPFRMTGFGPRCVPPLPGMSAFAEINVRTYVTVGGKPGVWFFSLDANSRPAVRAARWVLNLPYHNADVTLQTDACDGVQYDCMRTHRGAPPASFSAHYRPIAAVEQLMPGTLEHWLIERYCMYLAKAGGLWRLDIHHDPWPAQVAEIRIARNTLANPLGIDLGPSPPRLHFAKRLDAIAWLPTRVI
jgi:uncharacterized protein YqjF (DUF2071 family)